MHMLQSPIWSTCIVFQDVIASARLHWAGYSSGFLLYCFPSIRVTSAALTHRSDDIRFALFDHTYLGLITLHLRSSTRTPLLLPLLRRETLRRPSMNRGNLLLQRIINQPMPRQRRLLRELGRDDYCFEHLAAATCENISKHIRNWPWRVGG
jgi:hypothetical protein